MFSLKNLAPKGLTYSQGHLYHGLAEHDIDGLVQERRNSNALAMELRLSRINPSIAYNMILKTALDRIIHHSEISLLLCVAFLNGNRHTKWLSCWMLYRSITPKFLNDV